MKNYSVSQLILILCPFVFSFAFGLDIYIPVVPQMVDIFDTSQTLVQLTLSVFLFVTGVGQLLIGPLSDQYGRKFIFYASAAFYAVGSLGCAFAHHISFLIFARVISSIGACGMLVTALALIRDTFSGNQGAKMFSFLHGSVGISPIFAPIIGGYLATLFGWRSIFLFLGAIGCFALYISNRYIYETLPSDRRVKMDHSVYSRYIEIFTHRQFITHALIAGLAESVFFCFFSTSPFVIIELLNVPIQNFGYYFAIFGSVIALGGFGGGKIIEKFGVQSTMRLGIALMLAGGLAMLGWIYFGSLTLFGFLFPMVLACTGAMFLLGSSAACALEPFGHMAGTAAAAFGALEFGLAAFVGSILMYFPVTSTIPYGISILLMGLLSLSLFFFNRKYPQTI